MNLKDVEKGVGELSTEDQAEIAKVQAEKTRLGIIDDEPESPSPVADEGPDEVVLGPEDKPVAADPKPAAPRKEDEKDPNAPPVTAPEDEKNPKDIQGKKEPETPNRPNKYIPLPKYQEDKKEWDRQIAELTTQLEAAKKAGGKDESEAKIAALAEKMGLETETVQELVGIVRGDEPPATAPPTVLPPKNEEVKPADTPVTDTFRTEWDAALPNLRERFPKATADQISDAKDEIERLAHTDEYRRYPLDYIFFKEGKALNVILDNPRRKTAEPGAHGKADPVAPVDEGKPDFSDMTPAKARAIEKAQAEAVDREEGTGVRITRQGREMTV